MVDSKVVGPGDKPVWERPARARTACWANSRGEAPSNPMSVSPGRRGPLPLACGTANREFWPLGDPENRRRGCFGKGISVPAPFHSAQNPSPEVRPDRLSTPTLQLMRGRWGAASVQCLYTIAAGAEARCSDRGFLLEQRGDRSALPIPRHGSGAVSPVFCRMIPRLALTCSIITERHEL